MGKVKINNNLIINTILNNSQDTIYFKDENSAIVLSSRAHSLLWGVDDPREVIGKTDFDYFPRSFAEAACKDEKKIMVTGEPIIGRVEKLIKPDGSVIWLSASKYPFYDFNGEIIGTWGTSRDITDLKNAEEELIRLNAELEEANRQLRVLSAKDSLSGLYNHRYFYEELEKTVHLYTRQKEKDDSKDFSLILLDIDNFKNVNDTYGHLMGDIAIKHIAELMINNTRYSDSCFRHGGDEFAILLLDTKGNQAKEVAEKIRKIIMDTPIVFRDRELKLTISMGVSSFSEASTVNDLVKKADRKLYLSKNGGKNRVT